MNDASPRFAEGQTNEMSLISSEEGNLRLAELAQHAGELSVWFTEEGLRGATAGELFEGYCRRLSAMDSSSCVHTCRPRPCTPNGLGMATLGDEN